MNRDVRWNPDTERHEERDAPQVPPPNMTAIEAWIAALPIAMRVNVGPSYILCPTCAEPYGDEEGYQIEEDGDFGIRECEECGRQVRAK